MTITKKPSRPKKTEEPRDAIASAYIEATEKRAKTESASAAAAVKKASAKPKVKSELPPAEPAEAASALIKEKKSKEKGKEKDKAKKKKHKKKEAVIIRFEDAQLAGIDTSADALGLSRAAWVRMVVARALAKA
ncbi:hypothetical protein [Telmatospirillum siberiense]|nr:hypothetical protein [Telmatospirillum siberiense]